MNTNPKGVATSTTGTADSVHIIDQSVQTIAHTHRVNAFLENAAIAPRLTVADVTDLCVNYPGAAIKATITPVLAQHLLGLINTNNRPMNAVRVKQYVDVLSRGQYVFNGESVQIGLTSEGHMQLLNGQHRLQACAISGVEFETVLVVGLPTSVFSTIDRGKTRSNADVLSIAGFKNTHNITAAVRILAAMEAGHSPMVRSTVNLVTAEDVLRYTTEHEDELNAAHALGGRIIATSGGVHSAWMIFIVHAMQVRDELGLSADVLRFCNEVETGIGLYPGNPALALRQWLSRGGSRRKGASGKNVYEAATFISVFNKWVEGKDLLIVKPWAHDASNFPTVSTAIARR